MEAIVIGLVAFAVIYGLGAWYLALSKANARLTYKRDTKRTEARLWKGPRHG